MIITSYSVSGAAESRRDLRLTIAPDGSAEAEGAVLFPSGGGFIVLDAEPGPARCACADADGNGRVGLTRIEFLARDPRSGALGPVILAPRTGEDIDRAGRYELEVGVAGQPGATSVVVIPARRRKPRRRRRGRGKRPPPRARRIAH